MLKSFSSAIVQIRLSSASEGKIYSVLDEEWPMVLWWHLGKFKNDSQVSHHCKVELISSCKVKGSSEELMGW